MKTEAARRRPRVLVVEDEWLIANHLQAMLEAMDCEVIGPVPTTRRALQLIGEAAPDVAVLDISLGESKSFKVAEALRDRLAPCSSPDTRSPTCPRPFATARSSASPSPNRSCGSASTRFFVKSGCSPDWISHPARGCIRARSMADEVRSLDHCERPLMAARIAAEPCSIFAAPGPFEKAILVILRKGSR